jgi:hypothetical protein
MQAYLDNKWKTVRVSSCRSYVSNDDKYDILGKRYPKDFAIINNFHYELTECHLLDKYDMDYRILSARDGFYYMGYRNWSYCTLLEIQNGFECIMTCKNKLVHTLLILGLDKVNDANKIRFVYGFSDIK